MYGDATLEFENLQIQDGEGKLDSPFKYQMRRGFETLHHFTVNFTLKIKRFWS